MAAGLPFYLFVGLVHNFYLVDQLVYINRATCGPGELSEGRKVLEECLKPKLRTYEFMLLIEGPKDDPYQFMLKRCSLRPEVDHCLDISMETLNDCFNSTMLNGVDVWKKIDMDVLEYVCKNNAEVASDLFKKTNDTCSNGGVTKALRTCGPKLNVEAQLYDIQEISKSCSHAEEFDKCVQETLDQNCPDNINKIEKTIMQILKKYICQ